MLCYIIWTYVIIDLNDEEIVRMFSGKELQKTNQKEFKVKKAIKRKCNMLYLKWKVCEYFRKSKSLGGRVKAGLDSSNHATTKN